MEEKEQHEKHAIAASDCKRLLDRLEVISLELAHYAYARDALNWTYPASHTIGKAYHLLCAAITEIEEIEKGEAV